MIVWDWLFFRSVSKIIFMDELLFFTITTMKNFELFKKEQFRKCQATVAWFESDELKGGCGEVITIFYSYSCPELVKIGGCWYKFTYENSRKAGSITGSRTTSRQLASFYGGNRKDLPEMNLKEFEQNYFYTGIDGLY